MSLSTEIEDLSGAVIPAVVTESEDLSGAVVLVTDAVGLSRALIALVVSMIALCTLYLNTSACSPLHPPELSQESLHLLV